HCKDYAQAMRDYAACTLQQVEHAASDHVISKEDLADTRRGSICARTLFMLSAFGQDLVIPSTVLAHSTTKKLEALSIDIVVIHNDLVSYAKEVNEGVEHNRILNLQKQDMTFQDARDHLLDQAQDAIAKLFDDDNIVESQCLRSQESVGSPSQCVEFKEYVNILRLIPRVNLHWSFICRRFVLEDGS
ncbi:hypothetical protein LTR17_027680, partial [Elasticomyces elasticus]